MAAYLMSEKTAQGVRKMLAEREDAIKHQRGVRETPEYVDVDNSRPEFTVMYSATAEGIIVKAGDHALLIGDTYIKVDGDEDCEEPYSGWVRVADEAEEPVETCDVYLVITKDDAAYGYTAKVQFEKGEGFGETNILLAHVDVDEDTGAIEVEQYVVGAIVIGGTGQSILHPYKCVYQKKDGSLVDEDGDPAYEGYWFFLPDKIVSTNTSQGDDGESRIGMVLRRNGKVVEFSADSEFTTKTPWCIEGAWKSFGPFDELPWIQSGSVTEGGVEKQYTDHGELLLCVITFTGEKYEASIMPQSRLDDLTHGFSLTQYAFPVCFIVERTLTWADESTDEDGNPVYEDKTEVRRQIMQLQFSAINFIDSDDSPYKIVLTADGPALVNCQSLQEQYIVDSGVMMQFDDEFAGKIMWLAMKTDESLDELMAGDISEYRAYVNDPSNSAIPLYKFTEKDEKENWGVEVDYRNMPRAQIWYYATDVV